MFHKLYIIICMRIKYADLIATLKLIDEYNHFRKPVAYLILATFFFKKLFNTALHTQIYYCTPSSLLLNYAHTVSKVENYKFHGCCSKHRMFSDVHIVH